VKESEMHFIPVRWCVAIQVTLVLFLVLGASGCKESKVGKTRTFSCGDQQTDVNTTNGAKPQAVYLCEGDTVTWNPNGHTFLVEFKKDSPFEDGGKKFDNKNPKSGKTKHHDQLTVYEYQITVDGTVFSDPQVIGGGGN
jgi:plastocyanin